ncbi:MAG: cytochrome oxidase putative small subunit CydP [Pseudomonadota bacterium]
MFLTGKPSRRGGTKRPGLTREITLTLLAKLLLLYGLWGAFFSTPPLHSMTEGLDPGLVAKTLISPPTPTNPHNP